MSKEEIKDVKTPEVKPTPQPEVKPTPEVVKTPTADDRIKTLEDKLNSGDKSPVESRIEALEKQVIEKQQLARIEALENILKDNSNVDSQVQDNQEEDAITNWVPDEFSKEEK